MKKNVLVPLNLPPCELPLRARPDDSPEVWDALRRRWLVVTPEEWVRQNFVHFLQAHRGFPSSRIANEVALRLNGTLRRADTMVYTDTLRPLAVVEYKAPSVAITQKVFDQIARYNLVFGARWIIVSNGLRHFCAQYADGSYRFVQDIPKYSDL